MSQSSPQPDADWPHRSEPRFHQLPRLLHSSGSSPGLLSPSTCAGSCNMSLSCASQLVFPLCSVPHSPAAACNTLINASEKSLCTGQLPLGLPQPDQHCLQHDLPVPWTRATGWSMPGGCWGAVQSPSMQTPTISSVSLPQPWNSGAELWWFLWSSWQGQGRAEY